MRKTASEINSIQGDVDCTLTEIDTGALPSTMS